MVLGDLEGFAFDGGPIRLQYDLHLPLLYQLAALAARDSPCRSFWNPSEHGSIPITLQCPRHKMNNRHVSILGITAVLMISSGLRTLQAAPGQIPVCQKAQQKDTPATASFGFLTPGLNGTVLYPGDLSPNTFAIDGRTQFYAQLDQALKSRGIQLVISALPTRTLVYPEMIDATQPLQTGFNPDTARENYRASLRRLWGLHIYTIDMLSAALNYRQTGAKQSLYFARDYHWTSEGTKVYA
jgi:SGNH hydrolase-like domain, acetyltransferase AlgX